MPATTELQTIPTPPTFSTGSLGQWRTTVSENLLSLDMDNSRTDGNFYGQVSVAQFHNSLVADVQSSAHRVMRTRALIAKDETRHIKVIWQLSGRTQLEYRDGISVVCAGHWAIYDTSRPYTFHTSDDSRFQMLLLPIGEMADLAWCTEQIFGHSVPGGGSAEIARTALGGLLTGEIQLDLESQAVLQESILALMGNAFNQVACIADETKNTISKKLKIAQEFIEKNLTTLLLTPDRVAQACGMSRRSLYSAFSSVGLTPQAYIMKRRLAFARDLLADHDSPATITQVAYELGFADAAHFSRAFSKCYGVSPSQWRNHRTLAQSSH